MNAGGKCHQVGKVTGQDHVPNLLSQADLILIPQVREVGLYHQEDECLPWLKTDEAQELHHCHLLEKCLHGQDLER